MIVTDFQVLDCNSPSAKTKPVDATGYTSFTCYIKAFTGNHLNHVITIRESDDKKAWTNIANNIDEIAYGDAVLTADAVTKQYLQCIIDTVEDGASNAKILFVLT